MGAAIETLYLISYRIRTLPDLLYCQLKMILIKIPHYDAHCPTREMKYSVAAEVWNNLGPEDPLLKTSCWTLSRVLLAICQHPKIHIHHDCSIHLRADCGFRWLTI